MRGINALGIVVLASILVGAIGFGGYYLGHRTPSVTKGIGADAPSSHSVGGPTQTDRRIALVIGNAGYADKPLSHPKRDAADVAALLRGLGFEVTEATDLNLEQLEQRGRAFIEAARAASVRLFYYSGHGANDQNETYLLPVDHGIQRAHEIKRKAYPLEALLDGLREEAPDGVNVVLVDACRDAPFGENKSIGTEHKGLGRVMASTGTLVGYAAAPGQTAEGRYADRNSLFTKHLLQHLKERAEINDVLTRARQGVVAENPRQLPETRSLLTQPLFLAGPAAPPPALSAFDPRAAELSYWESIKGSRDPADFRDFLAQFPVGTFAGLAQRKLRELETVAAPPAVIPTPAPPPATPAVSAKPKAGQVFRDKLKDGSDGPAMVVIPAGRFQMGSPENEEGHRSNERQHEVQVAGFAIGQTEVTFEDYDRFCAVTGREKLDDSGWGRGRRPTISVSWIDAMAYAQWLSEQTGQSYRLPTEAEWERACRGGAEGERYCGGDNIDLLAWHSGNSRRKTYPVGQNAANGFGLYDMSGNVWEWTCSLYDKDYGGAETKCHDKVTMNARAVRGGAWGSKPAGVRSASRSWVFPADHDSDWGFRLARSL